jgi:hypothetical protein
LPIAIVLTFACIQLVAGVEQLQQVAVLQVSGYDDAAQWNIAQMKFSAKREGQQNMLACVETDSSGSRVTAVRTNMHRDPTEPQCLAQTSALQR